MLLGGIKTSEQSKLNFGLHLEKIAISSSIIDNPNLITEIALLYFSKRHSCLRC